MKKALKLIGLILLVVGALTTAKFITEFYAECSKKYIRVGSDEII